jgi:hypothetical protein
MGGTFAEKLHGQRSMVEERKQAVEAAERSRMTENVQLKADRKQSNRRQNKTGSSSTEKWRAR